MTFVRWDERHGRILSTICSRFSVRGIRYFIFRNFQGLPDVNSGKDVDIMVDPNCREEAKKILISAYRENGLTYYYEARHGKLHCYHGMDEKLKFSIHIDLIFSYSSKGFELFSFDELYSYTKDYKQFRVLNEYLEGVMVFIYKQFHYNPTLKPEYRNIIYKTYRSYPEFSNLLRTLIGADLAEKILKAIAAKDFNEMLQFSSALTKALRRFAFKKRPVRTLLQVANFYASKSAKLALFYRKYSKSVAVMAPDGSGKSTFIEALLDEIDFYFVNNRKDVRSKLYHFRPNLLPNLGAIGEKAGLGNQDQDFTNPHRSRPANGLSSLFRISYYWLDYFIGFNIFVRRDVQYDRFSVFDRYSYDLVADPARTRLKLPQWVRKLFVRSTPQPDLIFYLEAEPSVVFGRKQELTLDEIQRQQKIYREISEYNKRAFVLDASRPAVDSAKEAFSIILARFCIKL